MALDERVIPVDRLDRENCRLLLAALIEKEDLKVKRVAKAIGCSESTLARLLSRKTLPSDAMLKQVGILVELGFDHYSRLSEAEKEKISDTIGTAGGGALGFAAITAAIGALGSVSGLSAAGITSGLAALGTIVGGGMIAGVSVAAAIPLAGSVLGYSLIKTIKHFVGESELRKEELDSRWEISVDEK